MTDETDIPTISEDQGLQTLIATGHPSKPCQTSREAKVVSVNIWIAIGLNLHGAAEIYLHVLKRNHSEAHPAGMDDCCAKTIGQTDLGACVRNLKCLWLARNQTVHRLSRRSLGHARVLPLALHRVLIVRIYRVIILTDHRQETPRVFAAAIPFGLIEKKEGLSRRSRPHLRQEQSSPPALRDSQATTDDQLRTPDLMARPLGLAVIDRREPLRMRHMLGLMSIRVGYANRSRPLIYLLVLERETGLVAEAVGHLQLRPE